MSDRIAVMFDGEIAQVAEAEALYRRPLSRRVAEFIGVMNFLPARVEGDTVDAAGLGSMPTDALQSRATTTGDTVVGFRPETATLLYPGQSADGRVAEGEITEVVYYGDMTYYDVRISGVERPLNIAMKNIIGQPVLDVGAPAQVIWDERSLVLLK